MPRLFDLASGRILAAIILVIVAFFIAMSFIKIPRVYIFEAVPVKIANERTTAYVDMKVQFQIESCITAVKSHGWQILSLQPKSLDIDVAPSVQEALGSVSIEDLNDDITPELSSRAHLTDSLRELLLESGFMIIKAEIHDVSVRPETQLFQSWEVMACSSFWHDTGM